MINPDPSIKPPSAAIDPAAPEQVAGVRVGRYTLIRLIGSGGMGAVYEAEQDQPRRRVAVKLLNAATSSPSLIRRFERESQRMAQLRHPNIASIIEAGTHRHIALSAPFYAMELVKDGKPLTTFAEQQGLPLRDRIRLFLQACDAVHHAHAQGLLHRDLKPSNILVDPDRQLKLIDFGVAYILGEQRQHTLTDPSQLLGTLQYMSPEQFAPEPVALDARSDIYSLGLVLYELACGRRPYELTGKTVTQAATIIRDKPLPRPRSFNPALSEDLERVLLKALHRDRDRRYPTVAAFAEDLGRALGGEAVSARRDSIAYSTRVFVRRVVARQWLFFGILTVILATSVGGKLASLLERFSATGSYERFICNQFHYFPTGPLRHVRIITLQDGVDYQALAQNEGLQGVSASNRTSLRRLHGRLMEKLADSGATGFASAITFAGATEFDGDLAQGIRRLQQAGTPVIIGANWQPNAEGEFDVSPQLPAEIVVAGATAAAAKDFVWSLHLAVGTPAAPTLPSIALAAAATHASHSRIGRVDLAPKRMEVHAANGVFPFPITSFYREEVAQEASGINPGDFVAEYLLQMPSSADLQRSTLEYRQVMEATPAQRAQWFGGKIILLADARQASRTMRTTPDNRQLDVFYVHGVAIDNLIEGRAIRRLPRMNMIDYLSADSMIGTASALLAGIAALHWRSSRRRLLFAVCTLAAMLLPISILLFVTSGLIWSPTATLIGLALATGTFLLIHKCWAHMPG